MTADQPLEDAGVPLVGAGGLEQGMGRDVAWTALTFVLTTAAYFPLLAYTVRRIGTVDFGLFAIISSVTTLLLVVDFSLGTAVVRSTAVQAGAAGPGEREAARDDVNTAHSGLVAFGALIAVATVPLVFLVPQAVRLPSGREPAVILCMILLGAASAFGLGSAALPAVIRGHRRFAVAAVSTLAGVATRSVLVVVFVGHLGLVALGLAQVASVAVERVLQAAWVRRNVSWFRFRPRRVSLAAVRRTGSFALPLVILSVDAQLVAASDAVVIGAFVGASGVAVYRIGSVVPKQAMTALLTAFTVSFPALAGATDHGEQVVLMRSLTRLVSYLAGIGFALMAVFRQDVVELLLGRPSPTAETVLLVLCVTYAFDVGVHVMTLVLIARQRQWVMAVLSPVQLSVNLVLTVVLVKAMGPEGAAVAALVTFALIDLVLFPFAARREFTPPAYRIVLTDALLASAAGAVVCVAATMAVRQSLDPSLWRLLLGTGAATVAGIPIGLVALGATGRARLLVALRR